MACVRNLPSGAAQSQECTLVAGMPALFAGATGAYMMLLEYKYKAEVEEDTARAFDPAGSFALFSWLSESCTAFDLPGQTFYSTILDQAKCWPKKSCDV